MTSLSPLHTIGDQIGEALALHRKVAGREAARAVIEMLRLVGFPDPSRGCETYPFELSGGLRQRAMIAMALICRPALLIADEPTTALDVTIQAQILKLMIDLQAGAAAWRCCSSPTTSASSPTWPTRSSSCIAARSWNPARIDDLFQAPRAPLSARRCCARCRASTWSRASG